MDGLIESRMVHLVTSAREGARHCAAIVAGVKDAERGIVNLAVFTPSGQTYSMLDVEYSAEPRERSWHWVEREAGNASMPDMEMRDTTLAWFAGEMRLKLESNVHKGGWAKMGIDRLFDRLAGEMGPNDEASEIGELESAIYGRDWENVIEEAADVANFAMFIADVARREWRKL